jgi:hypothetical protein
MKPLPITFFNNWHLTHFHIWSFDPPSSSPPAGRAHHAPPPPQILREWFHFVLGPLLSGKSLVTSKNVGLFYFVANFQDGRRRQIPAKLIITFLFSHQILQMRYQNDRNK